MKQQPRGRFTIEFKVEAVRLVKAGQSISMTAKVLGISIQTLHNWVKSDKAGKLRGAGTKPVSDEQMEIARLRAENVRFKMERDILKKATAYFAKDRRVSR
jgi:transposase